MNEVNIVKEECTIWEERLISEIYKMFQFPFRRGFNIYKELTPNQTTFVILDIVMGVNVFKCNIFTNDKDRITGYIYDNNHGNWDFYILRVHDNVFTYYAERKYGDPKTGVVPEECAIRLNAIISDSIQQLKK